MGVSLLGTVQGRWLIASLAQRSDAAQQDCDAHQHLDPVPDNILAARLWAASKMLAEEGGVGNHTKASRLGWVALWHERGHLTEAEALDAAGWVA